MPSFVPVVDVEKPRHERDDCDENFGKHRKFDAMAQPSSSSKLPVGYDKKNKRGFADGSVGWGVLGEFGSSQKDDGSAAVHRVGEGKAKMVKNEKGLWVKAELNDEAGEVSDKTAKKASAGRGMGRGSGVPVLGGGSGSHEDVNLGDGGRRRDHDKSSVSKSRSRSRHGARSRDRSKDRGRHRRRSSSSSSRSSSRSRSRDRHRSRYHRRDNRRDRSYERDRRRRRSRSRSRSRDRHRRRRRSRSRSHDSHSRHRDRDRREDHIKKREMDQEKYGGSGEKSMERERPSHSSVSIPAQSQEPPPFAFNFTAAQVCERFLEAFSSASKRRLDMIEEVFSENAVVKSLKTGKELLNGKESIRKSFENVSPHPAEASKRVFVECSNGNISYCYDFYKIGDSPGFGDPTKEAVLLYRVENSVLTNVWGSVDKLEMASNRSLSLQVVCQSDLWSKSVLPLILQDEPLFSIEMCHFNDYSNIETIGS